MQDENSEEEGRPSYNYALHRSCHCQLCNGALGTPRDRERHRKNRTDVQSLESGITNLQIEGSESSLRFFRYSTLFSNVCT
jgi:hypothetical protein